MCQYVRAKEDRDLRALESHSDQAYDRTKWSNPLRWADPVANKTMAKEKEDTITI